MNKISKIIFLSLLIIGTFQITFSQEILYETYTERAKMAYAGGDYEQAEKLFKSALKEAEKLESQELIASSNVNLGKIYQTLERYAEAVVLYSKAIEIFDKLDGKDQLRSAFALNNVGLLYAEQKKFVESEQMLRKALTIREKLLEENSPDIAVTLLNMGKLYADQSKYIEANAVYVKALEILIQHPDYIEVTLICLHNLSDASYQLKEYKRAESAYKLAIGLIENNYEKNSKALIDPLTNYAIFLRKLKRVSEAIKVERRIRLLKQSK